MGLKTTYLGFFGLSNFKFAQLQTFTKKKKMPKYENKNALFGVFELEF